MTLIELLAVMAIAGVMVALAIPAVGLTGSNSLTAEGNRISEMIEQARQNSMTRNALTALILNTDSGTEGYMRAFSLWELRPNEGGGIPAWKQVSKWETLRDGIVVSSSGPSSWQNPGSVNPALPVMTYRGKNVSSYSYRVFQPNGALWGNEPVSVEIAEGFVTPGSANIVLTHPRNGKPANTYEVAIIPATGRARITRN